MKKLPILLAGVLTTIALALPATSRAQFLRTSYFMEGTSYRMQINPALTPGHGYINIPVVGALNATVNSSSLGIQDIFDIADNADDGDFFMSDAFYDRLSATNDLNVNLSTDIISAGWYKGKNFWSFNVGLRNDIGASIPRNLFDFMRDVNGITGTASDLVRLLALDEEVGKTTFNVNSYAEIGLGFARSLNSKLTVGGRVKALLGMANAELNINEIDIESNVLSGHAEIEVDASAEVSGKLLELETNRDGGYIDEVDFGSFGIGGYGAAIDLGIAYQLNSKLMLSASVTDLGFLTWNKSNTTVATANVSQSYDLYDADDLTEFVDKVVSGEVLNYDMLQLTVDDEAATSRTTSLSPTVALGAEYKMLNDWLVLGALYTARFTPSKDIHELSFSGTIRPKDWFNLSLSYSVIQAKGQTFGLAAKLGWLFIGTDYMYFGGNTKNVNAYLGMSIPLNKKKKS